MYALLYVELRYYNYFVCNTVMSAKVRMFVLSTVCLYIANNDDYTIVPCTFFIVKILLLLAT